MLFVAGKADIDWSKVDDADAGLDAMMAASRAEAGCLGYLLVRDPLNPQTILIHECWQDDAALKAHFAEPHMAVFQRRFGPAILKVDVKIYDIAGERPLAL